MNRLVSIQNIVTVQTIVHFTGIKTSPDDRKRLRDNGFVHITGLGVYERPGGTCANYNVGEKLTNQDLGKWNRNNGRMVIVTIGGEIWLSGEPTNLPQLIPLLRELCPNGQGGFVPCSNGEEIATFLFLQRSQDPDYCISYE